MWYREEDNFINKLVEILCNVIIIIVSEAIIKNSLLISKNLHFYLSYSIKILINVERRYNIIHFLF